MWWTLKVFGAKDVRVLDGGLPAWDQAGYAKETGEAKLTRRQFKASFSADKVRDFAAVGAALHAGGIVVDARSAPRFRGELPEPRPGLPSGHMPGALNLHYDLLSDAGRLIAPDKILACFSSRLASIFQLR